MKIYAIKNIQTGLYLSNGKAMARTRAKFDSKPRLFNTKSAASNALSCWLLGVWGNHVDYEGNQDGPTPPNKVPDDRKEIAEFLKVVEAEVKFKNA